MGTYSSLVEDSVSMTTGMASSYCRLALKFALLSRGFVLFLQGLFNFLLLDHEAGAFTSVKPEHYSRWDRLVEHILGGLTKWDSQYFLHIAEHSYTYENTLAFFPLYPFVIQVLANGIFFIMSPALNYYSCAIVSGAILNILLFTCSAYFLHKLSMLVLKNQDSAMLAVVLFSINPSSIFFSAIYSEALFSLLAFSSMYCIENGYPFRGALLIGLSCVTRSNGLMLTGYLIYKALKQISHIVKHKMSDSFSSIAQTCAPELGRLGVQLFICVTPFVMFQVYACMLYCIPYLMALSATIPRNIEEVAVAKNYIMPSENAPPWCYSSMPFPYAYVQRHYWDVGFLRYFQFKQIPNFLLAAPVVFLIGWFCRTWFDHVSKPWFSLERIFHVFEVDLLTPYIIHIFVQTVFCVFCIHVQVTTRISCSSNPIVYWAGASILLQHWQNDWRWKKREDNSEEPSCQCIARYLIRVLLKGDEHQRVLVAYFVLYVFIGTAMFSNYYPWT